MAEQFITGLLYNQATGSALQTAELKLQSSKQKTSYVIEICNRTLSYTLNTNFSSVKTHLKKIINL